ncbi:MAG: 5-formyltetrahydrofolate cyclo-ligase [Methanobacterium sp.]
MDDKGKLREEIWNLLGERGFTHRKTDYGRIPNFKGALKAANMLRDTPEWKDSRVVFSSPDQAQRKVREYALRDGKALIMASPQLKHGYLYIGLGDASGRESRASTIKGAFEIARRVQDFPTVDLVVEGSVAVDLNGGRLGKGGGYGDQEIEHLLREEAITEETPVATTVHEAQIIEKVPLEPHDKKIDMIVTPERVIRIGHT